MKTIDLNCDLGESFGVYTLGQDKLMLNEVTSANIACGYHAGDHRVLDETVLAAKQRGVAIGAHPGLPDLAGFGRRVMQLSAREVYQLMIYQLGAIAAFTRIHQTRLHHVKPHGALYNMASVDRETALAIVSAVRDFDPSLILYALAGSELCQVGQERGLRVAREVFADRTYQPDGTLTPRTQAEALIDDPQQAAHQILNIVRHGKVLAANGTEIQLRADTVCVHGDNEQALVFVRRLRKALDEAGIVFRAVGN